MIQRAAVMDTTMVLKIMVHINYVRHVKKLALKQSEIGTLSRAFWKRELVLVSWITNLAPNIYFQNALGKKAISKRPYKRV